LIYNYFFQFFNA